MKHEIFNEMKQKMDNINSHTKYDTSWIILSGFLIKKKVVLRFSLRIEPHRDELDVCFSFSLFSSLLTKPKNVTNDNDVRERWS